MTDEEMHELARTVFGQAEDMQRAQLVLATGLETLLLAMAQRQLDNGWVLQSVRPATQE
jgi:hypothetical protein